MRAADGDVWIIGPGRMGLALGSQLLECAWASRLTFIGRRPAPPRNLLFESDRVSYADSLPALPAPSTIFVATRDAAILDVAAALARHFESRRAALQSTTVLHLSGVLGSDALSPIASLGAAVASLHPLVSIANAERDAIRLRAAWFGIEGDSRGVVLANEIVNALGGRPLIVRSGDKALYHAAAVFASNYLVAVMGAGERLMAEAGVHREAARAALSTLAAGTLANVAEVGPSAALTGPVSRGDADTVERHLRRLSVEDRLLYSGLAREALHLAISRDLPPEAAQGISELLESELP